MKPNVLIVEHVLGSLLPSFEHILPAEVSCETKTWDNFIPENSCCSNARIILADVSLDLERAMVFFDWLRRSSIPIPVLAVLPRCVSFERFQTVVEAVDDFLVCPLQEEELKLRIIRMLKPAFAQPAEILRNLEADLGMAQLVGNHPAFLRSKDEVRLFATSEAPTIITGETGTGKELFAHAIHSLGPRGKGPFIPVDCGTLPEQLAENELFGHRRGAFTDAHADQKGLAAMAQRGTLFLDEIDSLSLANQSKLLRFLQEHSYRSLGADRFTQADVRIIAATNRNLEESVSRGLFRSDLYFRLNVLRLQLPALRDRPGDVPLLAEYFVKTDCAARNCETKVLSPAALRKLEGYGWPGNVRELSNVIQRALVYSRGRKIMPDDLSLATDSADRRIFDSEQTNLQTAKQQLIARFERAYIVELLSRHHGNLTQAAREAGKERRAFGRLVKKYDLKFHGIDPNRAVGQS
jgi:DNA-binding NtrC family response regulator